MGCFRFDRAPRFVPLFRRGYALSICLECKDWLQELNELEFSALTIKISNLVQHFIGRLKPQHSTPLIIELT